MTPDAEQVQGAVFQAIRVALGLSEEEGNIHIMRAYQDVPAAEPDRKMNVCYFFLQTDGHGSVAEEREVREAMAQVYNYLPCRIVMVFYGKDCEKWAIRCRNFLYQEMGRKNVEGEDRTDGADGPRKILRKMGIYLIPGAGAPKVVYEETGKSFRKRADLTVDARIVHEEQYGNVISEEAEEVQTVEHEPKVSLHRVGC